jgi:signal transduction histidine kinase
MNSALLLESLDALIGCQDLGELASATALLAQRLLGSSDAVVILRSVDQKSVDQKSVDQKSVDQKGADHEFVGALPSPGDELRSWAGEWLAAPVTSRQASSRGREAASIDAPELQGVMAVSFAQNDSTASGASSTAEERRSLLAQLAALAATCSVQVARRTRAERTLLDLRALMARGLHDLCTPLNSLRLGMHLLEPALSTKDPAIAQRAHRAVDRMAALVTTLAEAIDPQISGAARGASASSASQH